MDGIKVEKQSSLKRSKQWVENYEWDTKLWFLEYGVLPNQVDSMEYATVQKLIKAWNRKQRKMESQIRREQAKARLRKR